MKHAALNTLFKLGVLLSLALTVFFVTLPADGGRVLAAESTAVFYVL